MYPKKEKTLLGGFVEIRIPVFSSCGRSVVLVDGPTEEAGSTAEMAALIPVSRFGHVRRFRQ